MSDLTAQFNGHVDPNDLYDLSVECGPPNRIDKCLIRVLSGGKRIFEHRGDPRNADDRFRIADNACRRGDFVDDDGIPLTGAMQELGAKIQAAADQPADESEVEPFQFIPSVEFDKADYTTEYHVDGFLPVGQPAVLAAQMKTMKSTVAVAAGFSVATGHPLFGTFKILNPCRVAIVNAESGAGAMQEAGRRIAESHGMSLADATGLVWCNRVPQLTSSKQIREFEKELVANEIGLAILDPLYFMLPGDDANNLMKQGALLREMSEMLQSIGCSSLFVHHAKKLVANPGGPLELTDISWSGVGEWGWWRFVSPERRDYSKPEAVQLVDLEKRGAEVLTGREQYVIQHKTDDPVYRNGRGNYVNGHCGWLTTAEVAGLGLPADFIEDTEEDE